VLEGLLYLGGVRAAASTHSLARACITRVLNMAAEVTTRAHAISRGDAIIRHTMR
jgi:hypothetical protein